jgi:hypothetical protein
MEVAEVLMAQGLDKVLVVLLEQTLAVVVVVLVKVLV